MKTDDDDKLICLKCKYEIDRLKVLQNRKKGEFPFCPNCKIELSFKSPALLAEAQHPAVPKIIFLIAVLIGCLGIFSVYQHFKPFDGRHLMARHAVPGQTFYGGKAKSRIPGEWMRMAYSYDKYWKADFHSQMAIMVQEEHGYVYRGDRNGVIQIEYDYADLTTGKKGRKDLQVSTSAGQGIFIVPRIPYVKGSKSIKLKMVLDPAGGIRVEFF